MGDYYELKTLAGVSYIEYSNEKTGWNEIAVQLTDEQLEQAQAFHDVQMSRERNFYINMLEKAVNTASK